jgi:hypothetical protein
VSEPNRKAFLEQIRRLAGLDFFPKEEVAIRELFHALWDAAKSIDHAKRILDRWLASETKAPKPSEIRVFESQVPIVAEPPPPGCDDCRPTGGMAFLRTKRLFGLGVLRLSTRAVPAKA